jgi:hypothetical protein
MDGGAASRHDGFTAPTHASRAVALGMKGPKCSARRKRPSRVDTSIQRLTEWQLFALFTENPDCLLSARTYHRQHDLNVRRALKALVSDGVAR